jgi:hypothetical protein
MTSIVEVQEELAADTVDPGQVDRIVKTVDELGVCIEPDVISPERADQVNAIVRELLEQEITEDVRSAGQQRIGEIAVKHALFRELMCHPLVLAVWRRLLGADMVCSTWTANAIHPGAGSTSWHVDHPFWAMKEPYPTDWLAGQTVWMLDDLTEHNGATGYVSESHKRRHPPANPEEWPEGGKLATGTRGTVVFGHGAWWHTSSFNSSDQPRSVLLGMYISTIVIPMEEMSSQLQRIENPSDTEKQIMGGNQRMPSNIVTPPPPKPASA